jgi:hypothetical protein
MSSPLRLRIQADPLSETLCFSNSEWRLVVGYISYPEDGASTLVRIRRTTWCTYTWLNKFAQTVTLLTCILQVPASILGQDTDCAAWRAWRLYCFVSSPPTVSFPRIYIHRDGDCWLVLFLSYCSGAILAFLHSWGIMWHCIRDFRLPYQTSRIQWRPKSIAASH